MDDQEMESLQNDPVQIAFNLRGYVGAFSEENMVLEEDFLKGLQDMLKGWFSENMLPGYEQDRLRLFLWNYALEQVFDVDDSDGHQLSQEEMDKYIEQRVNREMKSFKEVLLISADILRNIYLDGREARLS